MKERIRVPIRIVNGQKWGHLGAFCTNHEVCADDFRLKDNKFSFANGHRVRLYKVSGTVHFKVPAGTKLDITDVTPRELPRRQQRQR